MSLLRWFTRKSAAPASSGSLGGADSTRPSQLADADRGHGNRKLERNARRQKLYAVVRDAMLQAGVLTSSYKFKVLSLDSRGRQFLVMVDLAGEPGDTDRLAGIERAIAQAAQARHGITVKGVYWRRDRQIGDRPGRPAAAAAAAPAAAARADESAPGADEVAAFEQALAEGRTRPTAVAFDGTPVQGPQSYTLLTGYEDTEQPPYEHQPALSATQYGELR